MVYGRDGFLHSKSHLCGVALYFPSSNYMLGSQGQYNLARMKEHFSISYGLNYNQYAGIIDSYHF